jgi:sugar-phosphatase
VEVTAKAPLGTFDAILFDFDGTLGDSHEAVLRAYAQWAKEYGVDVGYAQEYIGRPSATAAHALLPPEIAEEAGRRIDELESLDTDGVVALPGAVEALGAIGDDRRAIATSCTNRLLTARLAATGLPFPRVIVTCDDVSTGSRPPTPTSSPRSAWASTPRAAWSWRTRPRASPRAGPPAAPSSGCSPSSPATSSAPTGTSRPSPTSPTRRRPTASSSPRADSTHTQICGYQDDLVIPGR